MQNQIHYRNDTGLILRGRGGREIRPLESFWTPDYEDPALELTILEDNTPPIVRASSEVSVTATPQQVLIPSPQRAAALIEITVQAVTDGARIEVGFNREADPTAPVDAITRYCERVDTRRAYCLWLSGTGTARVIFKEVLNT